MPAAGSSHEEQEIAWVGVQCCLDRRGGRLGDRVWWEAVDDVRVVARLDLVVANKEPAPLPQRVDDGWVGIETHFPGESVMVDRGHIPKVRRMLRFSLYDRG